MASGKYGGVIFDSCIIGGGISGLSVAYQLRSAGQSVVVCDSSPGKGASNVAAGMLSPASEVNYDEDVMGQLLLHAARYWEEFAPELEERAGCSIAYERRGTLLVGFTEGDFADLKRLEAYQHHLGIVAHSLRKSEARELEPLLSPRIAGALHTPDDHQVDNRLVVSALLSVLEDEGDIVRERVLSLHKSANGWGVRLDCGSDIAARTVVIATGIEGLSFDWTTGDMTPGPALPCTLKGVRGDILRLQATSPDVLPGLCVRTQISGRWNYVVPRASGEIVVGASVEESSQPSAPRTGAIHELLSDALLTLPALRETQFIEASVGIRPGTVDNYPLVGPLEAQGIYLHTGHFRHGFLLAPLTARLLVDTMLNGPSPSLYDGVLSPARRWSRL